MVPNKKSRKPEHNDNPFLGITPSLTKILSVKDEDVLYLTWVLPN